MKIFLTGATGFLGSHIAEACLAAGHRLLCLRRAHSTLPHLGRTLPAPEWVTEGAEGWQETVKAFRPDVLVHAAWGGVDAKGRNDAAVQQENVEMSRQMMTLAPYRQIIMLGSQDEYGKIDALTSENHPLHPLSEYAKAKIRCCEFLRQHCRDKVEWQWIRIFSIYGPRQRKEWLIPSVITKCLTGEKQMETTKGEQQYSYLYSADLGRAVASVVGKKGKSGIYNLSSSEAIRLCDLFDLIKRLTGSEITFRKTLPYREHQSMVILGDASKFIHAFGAFEQTPLEEGLRLTIDAIRQQIEL